MTDPSTPLGRYTQQLRRQRVVYFSIVAVIVVAIGVVVGVAWSHGEVANTTLKTATAPPTLPVGAPSQVPKASWRNSDHAAIGTPQWRGTVVTFDQHTVRGVNARTGAETWSYNRSDRTVCTAAQLGGVTIMVYELAGNCDEVTAVDSGTGKRKWTRTLDMDAMPIYGHPKYQTYEASQAQFDTLLITGEMGPSKSVMYALVPSTGYTRWTYTRFGCAITGAVLGSDGALISQNCTNPTCGKLKFCGPGPQLVLRDAYSARDDDCKSNPKECETNPDKIMWNRIGDSDLPVSADELISAYNAKSATLQQLDGKDGSSVVTTPLSPAPAAGAAISTSRTAGAQLVWAAGVTYAIRAGTGAPVWRASTVGPPTLVANAGADDPVLSTARITVPSASGAWTLDGNSGRISQSFTLSGSGAGTLVYPLGSGFLVAGKGATAAST